MLHVVTSILLPLVLCIAALHPTILRWEEQCIAPRWSDQARCFAPPWNHIAPLSSSPLDAHGDAAVVLGYALERDGSLTPALQARVRAGVALYTNQSVPVLVFSGGHPGGGVRVRSEAAAMDAYARALLPVSEAPPDPQTQWLLEEGSTSTWENALYSLELLRLLTFRCAAKQLDIPCADILLAYVPPQGSQAVASVMERAMLLGALVREVAALVWYWLRGRLC